MASPDRATLLALAARCEAAKGPDRELDAAIARLLGWREFFSYWARQDMMVRMDDPPRYTASLDAAASLVPARWAIGSLDWWPMRACGAGVTLLQADGAGNFDARFQRNARSGGCALPALALCAAALRAMAEDALHDR